MNNPGVHYMFSGRFDSSYLADLYAGDMDSVMEIFESSTNHIALELNQAVAHFNNGDIEGLRKVFHKIKPLFGYVGLPAMQNLVQSIERRCGEAAGFTELQGECEDILYTIGDSLNLLRQEVHRMRSFQNVKAS